MTPFKFAFDRIGGTKRQFLLRASDGSTAIRHGGRSIQPLLNAPRNTHDGLLQTLTKVEKLEEALRKPETFAAASEALRCLIDTIVVTSGAKRGKVTVSLRGDLAAFMHLAEDGLPSSANRSGGGVMGSLVAGTRNCLDLLLMVGTSVSH
jgi:hypothetical protein